MLKIAWSSVYNHSLPEGHRFPMEKYQLIADQLLYEGVIEKSNFFEPKYLQEDILLLTHSKDYWQKLKSLNLTPLEIRKTGFPLSKELIDRECIIANGTVEASINSLENKVSFNVAGGTHHSFFDRGEGFCLLNDIAIASNYLLSKNLVKNILIVDLDVHQGNGTAAIFKDDPRVFTFSMHGANNYPGKKEKSDLDIGLPNDTKDEEYINILKQTLPSLIKKHNPDIVYYLSGVDVLETDQLGKLSLTKMGCKERDRFVFEMCKFHNIPVSVSMGGGYSLRIADIVDAHCNTFKAGIEVFF